MRDIYVVMPVHNHYELSLKLLHSLSNFMGDKIKQVLVVNDASDDETLQGLHWWKTAKTPLNVKTINLEENVGFLLASNLGLKTVSKEAQEDDLIALISNDVEIYADFTEQLQEIFYTESNILAGGVVYWHDTGWNTFKGVTYPYVEGWLLAATKAGWKELGYFDQQYAPCDFEDVDLSTKAKSLGYILVGMHHPGLHHLGGQTLGYTEERRKLTETNRKKFQEKWIK